MDFDDVWEGWDPRLEPVDWMSDSEQEVLEEQAQEQELNVPYKEGFLSRLVSEWDAQLDQVEKQLNNQRERRQAEQLKAIEDEQRQHHQDRTRRASAAAAARKQPSGLSPTKTRMSTESASSVVRPVVSRISQPASRRSTTSHTKSEAAASGWEQAQQQQAVHVTHAGKPILLDAQHQQITAPAPQPAPASAPPPVSLVTAGTASAAEPAAVSPSRDEGLQVLDEEVASMTTNMHLPDSPVPSTAPIITHASVKVTPPPYLLLI